MIIDMFTISGMVVAAVFVIALVLVSRANPAAC